MSPLLEHATYNDAHRLWVERRVTPEEIREWFPRWCVGKMEYRMIEGRPCEAHYWPGRKSPYWIPIAWIEAT
jgi:hypothetical protein